MKKIALAMAITTMSCGSAQAAVTSYTVAGTFNDGTALSGSFDYDNSISNYNQYSNFKFLVGTSNTYGSSDLIAYTLRSNDVVYAFINNSNAILNVDIFRNGPGTSLGSDTYSNGRSNQIRTSVIAPAVILPPVAGAVPEPGTWAMLILGMGAVGYSLRRRRASAYVPHAA